MTNNNTSPTPSTLDAAPAAVALAGIAELPAGTPGLIASPGEKAPSPGEASPTTAPPQLDRKGEAWDGVRHETPARLNRDGQWARLRGPRRVQVAAKVAPAGESKPDASAAPSAPANGSFLAPEQGTVMVAELVEHVAPVLTPEDYDATASLATRVLFGIATLVFGPAWKPTDAEAKEHKAVYRRVLAAWQAPRVGPSAELVAVWIDSASKRAGDEETRAKVSGWLSFLRRRSNARQVRDQNAEGAAEVTPTDHQTTAAAHALSTYYPGAR